MQEHDPRGRPTPSRAQGWQGLEFDSTRGYPGEGPPVEHIGNFMTRVGPAWRQNISIGRGLYAARTIEPGDTVARGRHVPSSDWDGYAQPRGLPDWAAIGSDRSNQMSEPALLYDASWETNLPNPSGTEAVRPKWTFMNHSKHRANCKMVPPLGPGNFVVTWVTLRRAVSFGL